jgi:hypothetical protein
MYVELQCSECGNSSRVSFALLYKIWKEGYAKMGSKHRAQAKAVTDIKCHCGHDERYDGPMFKYIFQLIFDEFVKEEKI